jgi:hypothetical protein
MQIKRLTIDESPQELIEFYRRRWGPDPRLYHEYRVGNWQVIATLRAHCFYTAQVEADGDGSVALLGVSTRPSRGRPDPAGEGFPALGGSHVVNDIDNLDGPKTARTIVLTNTFSPAVNLKFYQDALRRGGWTTLMDHAVDTDKGKAYVMVLKHGVREANITITQSQKGTVVLATIVDNP